MSKAYCKDCGENIVDCRCVEGKLRDDVDGLEEAMMRIWDEIHFLREKIKELEEKIK